MVFAVLAALLLAGCAVTPADGEYNPKVDAWPLLRVWGEPQDGSLRGEGLGPLVEWHSASDDGAFFFRPLYNRRNDKQAKLVESEWLWPFGTGTFRPDLAREVFYPLAVWDNELFPDGETQKRRMLLPILYYRSGRTPTDWLVLPLGGVLHDFFARKKIVIVLWPLWVYQAGENVRSWSFLQPVFTFVRWDDGGRGYRCWPLFGINRRPGKLRTMFVLWPLWQQQWMKSEAGEFRRFFLFPFYGRIDDPKGWEWTVLWPFISRRVDESAGTEEMWYFWPFFGTKSGRVVRGRSFWPVCTWETSREKSDTMSVERRYINYLWPLGWYRRTHGEYEKDTEGGFLGRFGKGEASPKPKKVERVVKDAMSVRLVPLFFREWEQRQGKRTGAWQVWPLVKYCDETAGSQFEFPSLFPYRWYAEWERNFAPLFRVFEYCRSADGVRSWRFLWRVARVDKGPRERYFGLWPLWECHRLKLEDEAPRHGWTLLRGFLGHERAGEYGRWRFLYLICVETDGPKTDSKVKE